MAEEFALRAGQLRRGARQWGSHIGARFGGAFGTENRIQRGGVECIFGHHFWPKINASGCRLTPRSAQGGA